MVDLEFRGNDPGAVTLGNFINYYAFHSVDKRIDNLNPEMFKSASYSKKESCFVCLDIGCNSGELTIELHRYLKNLYPNDSIHILAVDVDPTLITRAKDGSQISNITYTCLDITENNVLEYLEKYLRVFNKTTFDVSFCFSVTMWIHINNGDTGLLSFLQLIKDVSERVIIEPQPWKCYRNAQRRLKKAGGDFPLYKSIEIRSDVVEKIVEFMSQANYTMVITSISSSWNRKIYSFQRNRI